MVHCARRIAHSVVNCSGINKRTTCRAQNLFHTVGRAIHLGSQTSWKLLDISCLAIHDQRRLIRVSSLLPDREEDSFQHPATKQYTILRVRGDGNCLFRALVQSRFSVTSKTSGQGNSWQLSAEEETTLSQQLRQKICDTMTQQRDFIEPFLPECNFESYIRTMRQESTWGGEPELSMASLVLQLPIVVYGPRGGSELGKIAEYDLSGATTSDEVAVLYSGGVHYDSLIESGQG